MKRTNTFAIEFKDPAQAMERAIGCSSLWNEATYRRRQSFFNGETDWNTADLYKAYAPSVGAATAQQIIRKNDSAWRAFFKLLKLKAQGKLPKHIQKVSPPGYWKDRDEKEVIPRILVRNDGYRIDEQTRMVKLPKKLIGRLRGNLRWHGKQGTLEIIYNRQRKKWYAHQPVETQAFHQPIGRKTAYVDIGVKYPICAYVEEDKQSIAFPGGPLLSDWWYQNHRIVKHQSILRGTNNKHKSRMLSMLYRKRKLRFRQVINSYVYRFVRWCWKKGVNRVIAGDLTGIRDNNRKGKKANAMVHNFWSHSYLIDRLQTTLENFGMTLELKSEAGTSSECPWCGSTEVIKRGRLLKCKSCKREAHRDTAGCLNIGLVHGTLTRGEVINRVVTHPLVGETFSFHAKLNHIASPL